MLSVMPMKHATVTVLRLLLPGWDIASRLLIFSASNILLDQLKGRFKTPPSVADLVAIHEFGQLAEAQTMSLRKTSDCLPKNASLSSTCIHQHSEESLPVLPC